MNFITVADFINLCTDSKYCKVEIYDDGIVYTGKLSEIPIEYKTRKVDSFDPIDEDYPKLCLNVSEPYEVEYDFQ